MKLQNKIKLINHLKDVNTNVM